MLTHFTESCAKHSKITQTWTIEQIAPNGKLIGLPDDLTCYYKLPYLLTLLGQPILANHVLDHMKTVFFTEKQQITFEHKKTNRPSMRKFWGYVLGWVAIACQKLGRFDLSYPLRDYLLTYQSQDHGGFATSGPWGIQDNAMDVITTAQLGRLALYSGMQSDAMKAGEFLGWHINHQPQVEESLYLFRDNEKNPVTDYPSEQEMIYLLKKKSPQQAYFMIGLPCGYLIELYQATQTKVFLNYAQQYGNYALECHESIKTFHYSHKVAWAMSLLYRQTQDERYLTLSKAIAEYLIKIQDPSGIWLKEEDNITSFDQTIENAIWLQEIAINLS